MEVRERIVVFTRAMQLVGAQPYHSLRLVVPRRTPVIMPMTQTVRCQFPGGRTDGASSNRLIGTLIFECSNDRVGTALIERRARLESEIGN
jgi:hypothetical protein